jgi:hypothetical protein
LIVFHFASFYIVVDEDKECSTNIARRRAPLLNKKNFFVKYFKIAILALLSCLLLVACRAESSIDITFNSANNNSGEFKLSLKLDDEAQSIIRADAYKPIDLLTVFNNEELKKLDFKVVQNSNNIVIGRKFESKEELNSILDVLVGKDILSSEIISNTSLIKQKRGVVLNVELSKIKELYLSNENIKTQIINSGIEYSEYEMLISKAFEATTLKVKLKDEAYSKSELKEFSGNNLEDGELTLKGDKFRVEFLLGNIVALSCLFAALFLLFRKWHTPRLISRNE